MACSANICQVDKNFVISVVQCCKFLPIVHGVEGRPGLCSEWLIILGIQGCRRQGGAQDLPAPVKLNQSSQNPRRHGSTPSPASVRAPGDLSRRMEDLPRRKRPLAQMGLGTLLGVHWGREREPTNPLAYIAQPKVSPRGVGRHLAILHELVTCFQTLSYSPSLVLRAVTRCKPGPLERLLPCGDGFGG